MSMYNMQSGADVAIMDNEEWGECGNHGKALFTVNAQLGTRHCKSCAKKEDMARYENPNAAKDAKRRRAIEDHQHAHDDDHWGAGT